MSAQDAELQGKLRTEELLGVTPRGSESSLQVRYTKARARTLISPLPHWPLPPPPPPPSPPPPSVASGKFASGWRGAGADRDRSAAETSNRPRPDPSALEDREEPRPDPGD